jgi:hypothetical protein
MCELVGTTIYAAAAIEQTWIGNARRLLRRAVNRRNAAPSAAPRFVLEGTPDCPTAALAKRK